MLRRLSARAATCPCVRRSKHAGVGICREQGSPTRHLAANTDNRQPVRVSLFYLFEMSAISAEASPYASSPTGMDMSDCGTPECASGPFGNLVTPHCESLRCPGRATVATCALRGVMIGLGAREAAPKGCRRQIAASRISSKSDWPGSEMLRMLRPAVPCCSGKVPTRRPAALARRISNASAMSDAFAQCCGVCIAPRPLLRQQSMSPNAVAAADDHTPEQDE